MKRRFTIIATGLSTAIGLTTAVGLGAFFVSDWLEQRTLRRAFDQIMPSEHERYQHTEFPRRSLGEDVTKISSDALFTTGVCECVAVIYIGNRHGANYIAMKHIGEQYGGSESKKVNYVQKMLDEYVGTIAEFDADYTDGRVLVIGGSEDLFKDVRQSLRKRGIAHVHGCPDWVAASEWVGDDGLDMSQCKDIIADVGGRVIYYTENGRYKDLQF